MDCNLKKEGAQPNQTPWQDTDPHGAQISEVPKLNRGPYLLPLSDSVQDSIDMHT